MGFTERLDITVMARVEDENSAKNSFTPEEEEQIRRENEWAEE